MDRPLPPRTEAELLGRARELAGRTMAAVAGRVGMPVPPDLRRWKGWAGQLLEIALGADAGSRAEPDFTHLGIELKTIPLDARGTPTQSTWVCTMPLDGSLAARWEESHAFAKLARVLWVPIVGDSSVPLPERVVGSPFLWSPDASEEARLRADWEELTDFVRDGALHLLRADLGEVLQVRPKAATSRDTAWTLDADAEWVEQNPRGFYLRRSFTKELLARHFGA